MAVFNRPAALGRRGWCCPAPTPMPCPLRVVLVGASAALLLAAAASSPAAVEPSPKVRAARPCCDKQQPTEVPVAPLSPETTRSRPCESGCWPGWPSCGAWPRAECC